MILGDNNVAKLNFAECSVILSVEPLTSSGNDTPYKLRPRQMVLWLGYYIVVVEPAPRVKQGQIVQAYFKVRSQELGQDPQGRSLGVEHVQAGISLLV